ncbi:PD-(D/E)XK nuclease-like domain-containing protein [Chryseobacterium arthrosphaerae]|uniref:PD-(D/E)XK nuclease-like domain-containing protein n=1 Tax=Chryseobacterium arthrosphaerae TaxID=651561 RepID=A0ABU7R2X2_9FLAO
MGAMKNTAIEQQEQNAAPVPYESSPKNDLIQKLISKDFHLSYSKLKHLTSPVNFINAMLEPKTKNAGMTLGTIVDCLLLTEEKFEREFSVVKSAPTTDLQVNFVTTVIDKMKMESVDDQELFQEKFDEAYGECYKKGSSDSLDHLKDYIIALIQGKEVISSDDYEKAKKIVERLKNADEVCDELAEMESFQKKLEFKYKGWNFICFLDTYFPGGFDDLKFASDCSPDKYQRDLEKFCYDIQIGVYAIGFEVIYGNFNPTVKHIVYDAVGNYGVYPIDSAYVDYCKRKVDFMISCLDHMITKKAFDKSYNFFRRQHIIYKPKWAPGFDHTIFNEE